MEEKRKKKKKKSERDCVFTLPNTAKKEMRTGEITLCPSEEGEGSCQLDFVFEIPHRVNSLVINCTSRLCEAYTDNAEYLGTFRGTPLEGNLFLSFFFLSVAVKNTFVE
jgi:hypothetical protein